MEAQETGISPWHAIVTDGLAAPWAYVVYEIYNSWAADFCKTNPARLVALACVPNDDPALAAAELRRAARLGLSGVIAFPFKRRH